MIKFRCKSCDQKLGVPEKYAGRRVRCNKCSEPALVPQPAVAAEPAAASPVELESKPKTPAAPQPPQTDIFAGFEDSADDDDARRMEAIQMARQDRTARKSQSVKYSGKSAKEKGRSKSASEPKEGFSIAAFADMVPPALAFPLSLLTSFIAIGIAIAIWIGMARWAETTLGFMALLVFAAAAYGLRFFMVNRTFLLGILGLLIALAGFGLSKVALAKYVIKDYYIKLSNEEIVVNMDKILADAADKDKGQTKSISTYASNYTYQVCTAMLSMVDDDELDPVKARGWMINMLKGTRGPTSFDALLGTSSPMPKFTDMTDEEREAISTASGMAFEWDLEKKLLGKTKKYFPVLIKLINQANTQKILADPDRVSKFCLVQSIGPLDAIWTLVGMGMCFIILTFD